MKRIVFVVLVAALTAPVVAAAGPGGNAGVRGWGPRIGITSNPDEVHFGAHLDLAGLGSSMDLIPNLEVGVSNERTLVAFNMEAAHRFPTSWGSWTPYAGGGLGVNMRETDTRFGNVSNSGLGASILGGIERPLAGNKSFFVETKVGLVDSPDLKLTIGWTFFR